MRGAGISPILCAERLAVAYWSGFWLSDRFADLVAGLPGRLTVAGRVSATQPPYAGYPTNQLAACCKHFRDLAPCGSLPVAQRQVLRPRRPRWFGAAARTAPATDPNWRFPMLFRAVDLLVEGKEGVRETVGCLDCRVVPDTV